MLFIFYTAKINTPYINDYKNAQQGSFFLQHAEQKDYLLSPLLNTDVNITISGLVARVKVTQEFTNNNNEWVNGVYVFPLPENAAIDHLTMTVGERTIEGKIQPKGTAKTLYEKAKNKVKRPV